MAQEQGMSKVGHNNYRSGRDPGDRRWTHVTVLVEFVNQHPSPRWKHPDMPDNGRAHPDCVEQCHMAPCAVPFTVVIVQCIVHNTSLDLAVKSIGRSIYCPTSTHSSGLVRLALSGVHEPICNLTLYFPSAASLPHVSAADDIICA